MTMTTQRRLEVDAQFRKDMEIRYPQGWRYYPGDTCKHGVYIGGCGADRMCSICESGE